MPIQLNAHQPIQLHKELLKEPLKHQDTTKPLAAKLEAAESKAMITPASPSLYHNPSGRLAIPSPSQLQVYFGYKWDEQRREARKALSEILDFDQYYSKVGSTKGEHGEHLLARTPYSILTDMVESSGTQLVKLPGQPEEIETFNFFTNPTNPDDAIVGYEAQIQSMVNFFRQAKMGLNVDKNLLVLVGPPGSAKSTMLRLMKKGLDEYTSSPACEMYRLVWTDLPESFKVGTKDERFGQGLTYVDEMNTDPMLVLPKNALEAPWEKQHYGKQELPPLSKWIRDRLLEEYDYDLNKVLKHVRAERITLSEHDRQGVATFEPRDSKSITVEQLVGDVNLRKLAELGRDSDPRSFSADGELMKANRGLMEFIEVGKLPEQFMFLLLSLCQEKTVKPNKQPLVDVNEAVIGHSNVPEWNELLSNPRLEAVKNRITVIKFPYLLNYKQEAKIYEKVIGRKASGQGYKLAPHTLETAAIWAIMSRFLPPSEFGRTDNNFQLLKANAFAGDKVKYMPKEGERVDSSQLDEVSIENDEVKLWYTEGQGKDEGMNGISPREMERLLPNAFTTPFALKHKAIDGFDIIETIRDGLKSGFGVKLSKDERLRYAELLKQAEEQLNGWVKADVMEAIINDPEKTKTFLSNYIEYVKEYNNNPNAFNNTQNPRIRSAKNFMEDIEKRMGITANRAPSHRKELFRSGESITWDNCGPKLRQAILSKAYDDAKAIISIDDIRTQMEAFLAGDDDSTPTTNPYLKFLVEKKGYHPAAAARAILKQNLGT